MTMAELPTPVPRRAMIGRWNVDQYIDLLRWPMIIGGGLILILGLTQRPVGAIMLAEIAGLAWTAWIVRQHHGQLSEALASGVTLGLSFGLAYSLGRFSAQPNFQTAISIVWQTLVTGIVGGCLVTSFRMILSIRNSQN